MKNIIIIYLISSFVFLTGCSEDLLEKNPITALSPETFFLNANDFKLYTNQFYDDLGDYLGWTGGIYYHDEGTDNQILPNPNILFNGQHVITVNDNNWDSNYSQIRKVNIMLANTDKANWEDIKGFVAEGRFFRARYYFNLLRRFGDVPWIDQPLNPNDIEAMQTPRAPRNIIADNIIADLDFAIENLPGKTEAVKFRLFKEVAMAFKSRVCLYEGTWQKYHAKKDTPFKVTGSDGSSYLQQAVAAAEQVINSGLFSIEKDMTEPYYNLFNRYDYSSNKEVIFWRQNDRTLRQMNISGLIQGGTNNYGLTKSLIDAYLCLDGKPLSLTTLEVSDDSLSAVVINRDPRLAQTIFYPGVPKRIDDLTGNVMEAFEYTNLFLVYTGYHFRKGGSVLNSYLPHFGCQVGYIYFRYAEVLLNYIEAKAELNETGKASLTQNDFDLSINKLRERVDMPPFNFSDVIIDPVNPFTGKIPWYLVEIRRERRIELAIEGYRTNDIFRWAAADELLKGRIFRGAKLKWYLDNGWYSAGEISYVDTEGYLSPWHNTAIDLAGGYNFNLSRDYLYPIPLQEVQLAGYVQNPGWE
jgi:starch-binding outer membrane protein, SusD/RagB family